MDKDVEFACVICENATLYSHFSKQIRSAVSYKFKLTIQSSSLSAMYLPRRIENM